MVAGQSRRLGWPGARFRYERWSAVRAVVFAGHGGNEVVRLEQRPDPVPGTHEVLVAARFAGINWADVAQRMGNYPPPPGSPADIPGLEVAGVVAAVGQAVRAWHPGDRVFGIVGGGGLADRVAVHERHVAAIPADLADDLAAAVPEAYITAHDAVFTRSGLLLGEVLLVNGANGAVGSAAVELGLAAGARDVANVRSPGSAAALAKLGALIVSPEPALPLLATGRVVPLIDRVFSAADVADAFDYLARPGKSGKILLEFS